jgi:cytochrome c-type biogenesis protein CcmH
MKHLPKIASFVFCLAFVIGLMATAGAAMAQNGSQPTPALPAAVQVSQDDVNRIARQMYCPVCENEPLDACRTAACAQWRAEIAQLLSAGQTDQQVKDYFVQRYGLRVLAQPPAVGTTLGLWVLPIIGLVVGVVIVIMLMRRMRARAAQAAATTQNVPSSGDEYIDRVERDLKNY